MGGTTVDTAALAAAGRAASGGSRRVTDAATGTPPPLDGLAAALPGAQTAHLAAALRQAVVGVLAEVGGAMDRLGRLLGAAAEGYGRAEQWSAGAMAGAPVPPGEGSGAAPAVGGASRGVR